MSAPLTLADAQAVIAAAAHRADEVGRPVNIAVVDAGGNLIAHVRQDEAWIGSIDISICKARTARVFNTSTGELGANSQPGQQFFGIHATNSGRVAIFAGGLPLTRDDVVVGASASAEGPASRTRQLPKPEQRP